LLHLPINKFKKTYMKKIYLSLSLIAVALGANAQQKASPVLTANPINKAILLNDASASKTAATSTLTPPTFSAGGCATNTANIVYYSSFGPAQASPSYTVQGAGYPFGTNKTTYTLSATLAAQAGTPTVTDVINIAAQKYSIIGSASVTDIIVGTAKAEGTGIVTAKIYGENATTKGPSTQIGVSATKGLGTFTGSDVITFGTPVNLTTGNFFAAIESPAMGGAGMDTLCILSTSFGCSSTDSLSWVFDVVSPAVFAAGWSSVKTAFNPNGNLDLLIFPVVDITTGINNSISKGNLTLLAAFPNPATNDITINFGLNQSSKVEIEVYDVTGKIVSAVKLDNLEAGNHSSKLNTANLNAGVYMYSVKSDNAKMFSKFTISK
jgi:hypothetical protein